eukprot:437858_1
MGNQQQNKYQDQNDSDSDHDYQEVVVNGSDYRKPVYKFVSHRDLQIIKCIGQIEAEYNYIVEHDYKESSVGTGTVYRVTNDGSSFILSCAHNVRHQVKHCSKCNTYNPTNKKCSKCNNKCDQRKVIQPTAIEFHRYTTTDKDFAHLEDSYVCKEIYVPEAYDEHRFGEKGFDFAILMITDHDDGYYAQNCHNIKTAIGSDVLKQYKRFSIFGYPGKDYENAKKDELWGYAMKSDADEKGIELIECDQSYDDYLRKTEYTLRQRYVDASPGQSGSAVFVKVNNNAIIFAVHIGGHSKDAKKNDDYAYNRATLLSSTYNQIMRTTTQDKYKEKITDVTRTTVHMDTTEHNSSDNEDDSDDDNIDEIREQTVMKIMISNPLIWRELLDANKEKDSQNEIDKRNKLEYLRILCDWKQYLQQLFDMNEDEELLE